MNFYKHHLGDYAAATAHLSWDEDCAYRRLLDAYYKRETPIPESFTEACRLGRAQSASQRKAVETVLREFFLLKADGWHQKRCDLEIETANAQAHTNRRIATNRELKKRARTEHESLHESLNETCTNRPPGTNGEREPSQTPDSRLQTPDKRVELRASRLPATWRPSSDLLAWAKNERPDLDPNVTIERFRDYWTGKAGKDGVKTTWDGAYRNWVRSERVFAGAKPVIDFEKLERELQ